MGHMMKRRKDIFAFGVLILFLICAAGSPARAEDVYIPFTKEELEELLIGNTYPLVKGGFYFPDGVNMVALWKGVIEETTWEATDESSICYSLKMFGGYECLGLYKRPPDLLIQVFEDQERVWKLSDVREGKQFYGSRTNDQETERTIK